MAAGHIWTRIVVSDIDNLLPAAHKPISIHTLGAALIFRATGTITTDTPLITAFSLDADGQADLNSFKAAYTAQPTAVAKASWLHLLESAFILTKEGLLTEAQAKSMLGIV